MSDPRDLGVVAQVRSPHLGRPVIYLWETVPGGVGLATPAVRTDRGAARGGARPHRGLRLRDRLPGMRRARGGDDGDAGLTREPLAARLLRQLRDLSLAA